MTLRPSTRTYGQVKRAVKRIFGDEAGVQVEDADILQWSNDAQQAINTKNKIFKAKSTTLSVIGQREYTFPVEQIQQVESITFDGYPLTPTEMVEAQAKFSDAEGSPLSWTEWAGKFVLFPAPNIEKEIALFFTRYPVSLSGSDEELLDVPDKYFQAVVDYVLWKCYEMDEDWNGAQLKENHFRGALEEQAEEEREVGHMTYPTITEVW